MPNFAESGVATLLLASLWFVLIFAICAGITAWLTNWVKTEAHSRRIEEHVFLAELDEPDADPTPPEHRTTSSRD